MALQRSSYRLQQGFTLVELVVTLLVSAIMAIGVITYIGDAISGFSASSQRSKLASAGRIAVDRIERELYNAVPNSIRTTPDGQCLEFMPVVAATTYLDPQFGSAVSSFKAVPVPAMQALEEDHGQDVFAVIFPIEVGALYAANDTADSAGPRAKVKLPISSGEVELDAGEAPNGHRFERRSPVDRLYLAGSPVSFCVVGDMLFRYQDYGLHEEPCAPGTANCLPTQLPQRVLISAPLDNAGAPAFRVDSPTLRRNALVALDLNFSEQGDVVRMRHEVMTRNVP